MRSALFLAFFCGSALASTGPALSVPADVLAAIVDDEPTLPRGFTDDERRQWQLPDLSRLPFAPPAGGVRALAETEPNDGLLIRWGSQNALLTEMTVAATTGTTAALMHIVVSSTSQQSSAAATLSGAGAQMSRVRFIVAPSNSVWMRDYGPRFIATDSGRAMVDHTYNRPRPQDNAIPGVIAQQWSEPKYDIPLTHGGGNFHLFDDRSAYMTNLIQSENPALSAQQIRDYYLSYQGLDVTLLPALPASFDSTQHIDMWMLPADNGQVLVNRYPNTGGTYSVPYTVSEDASTLLASRGKIVLRLDGWQGSNPNGGLTHYTYANAVVLNEIVMICRFNGFDAANAAAARTFATAFPGRQIVAVDCSSIIHLSGAIHCIVMHVSSVTRTQPAALFRDGFEP